MTILNSVQSTDYSYSVGSLIFGNTDTGYEFPSPLCQPPGISDLDVRSGVHGRASKMYNLVFDSIN